jgi:hypothetical protein
VGNFGRWAATPGATPSTGDFNADGRTDIALTGGAGWTTLPVANSVGDGSFSITNTSVGNFGRWAATPGATPSTGDFNADGRTDIALTGGAGWTILPVATSTGAGGFDISDSSLGDFGLWAAQPGATSLVGDFDADARLDIALTGGPGWTTLPVAVSREFVDTLYLAFDGYSITRSDLDRWSSDWSISPNLWLDPDRNGIEVQPVPAEFPQRQQVIHQVINLVRRDLAVFNVDVVVLEPGQRVVEGVSSTTIFLGKSTTSYPHIAGDIDVGNNNRTDIAFVDMPAEDWGTVDRTALALADVILHEAGHTYGLYHVESGTQPETMGLRYSTPDTEWIKDTSFLNEAFPIRPSHGPVGNQNSFEVMANNFGTSTLNAYLAQPVLDLISAPDPTFVPKYSPLELELFPLPLTGDYNSDGVISDFDYDVWKASFGSTTDLAADGSKNGIVDVTDYVIWRNALKHNSSMSVASGQAQTTPSVAKAKSIGVTVDHAVTPLPSASFAVLDTILTELYAADEVGGTEVPDNQTADSAATDLVFAQYGSRIAPKAQFSTAGARTNVDFSTFVSSPDLALLLAVNDSDLASDKGSFANNDLQGDFDGLKKFRHRHLADKVPTDSLGPTVLRRIERSLQRA